jgi:hypothetical protein
VFSVVTSQSCEVRDVWGCAVPCSSEPVIMCDLVCVCGTHNARMCLNGDCVMTVSGVIVGACEGLSVLSPVGADPRGFYALDRPDEMEPSGIYMDPVTRTAWHPIWALQVA